MKNIFTFTAFSLTVSCLLVMALFYFFEPLTWGEREWVLFIASGMVLWAIGAWASQMFREV